ncbi:MAG: hypothetical protein WCT49_03960 [Candidatus Paceibacterota bacterium]|jgi:hypothetical protein|nr:hypothetical protein [Candidatus Paceibacterota bacterium]
MFFGITMLVLLSGVCFFGARGIYMAVKSYGQERHEDRVFRVKTFWTLSIAAVLLFLVALMRILGVYLGIIEDLSSMEVSWGWFLFAAGYALQAYTLNKKIQTMRKK